LPQEALLLLPALFTIGMAIQLLLILPLRCLLPAAAA
jgi:hypothetical protein